MMRYFKICVVLLFAGLFCKTALAQTITVVPPDHPVVLPYGQSREFQFGTVPQANTTVLLKIKSRMDLPSLLGSLHFMHLTLNGHDIEPAKGRFTSRLVNKPLSSPVTPNLTVPWYDAGSWNVLYAPDFKAAYSQTYYVGDPYLYVLDVTDLTNPVAENRLGITNTASDSFVKSYQIFGNKLDLVIGSVEIETKPQASPMMADVESLLPPVVNHGEPAAGPAKYKGTLFDGGGFALAVGKNVYNFASAFSYPDAGFNQLKSTFDSSGQKGWKVTKNGNKIIAQSPDYTVTRTINFGARCVEISDAITNRHKDAPLGLSVRNEMNITHLKSDEIRLAGNPDPTLDNYHSYGNPSVYVRTGQTGIGIITEDDVYRNQSLLYAQNDDKANQRKVGIRTDMLYLPPGGSYTLKWAVYPVAGPDYYDFINLVRQDWNVNYTAPGFWLWGLDRIAKLSPDEIRTIVKRENIYAITATDWVDWAPRKNGTQRIGFGSDVFNDHWADRRLEIKDDAQKVRQAAPEVKMAAYYNSLRESSDDTLKRFPDSIMIDSTGNPMITSWASTGPTNSSYLMVATLENSFGKEMVNVARRYMDDMGLDGLYIDEFEGAALYGETPITYKNNFDGHSCILDPQTWRIKQQVGIVPLSNTAFKKKVIDMVLQRNGPLMINGASAVKGTAGPHINRMIETQHNDYYGFEGLLNAPLGYLSWNNGWEDYLKNFKEGLVPAMGMSLELPPIAEYLFPFTPIELHSGYLLGKERIIATHSGNYGWHNEKVLSLTRCFDENGKLTEKRFPIICNNSGAKSTVQLGQNEAAVLIRLPMSFNSSAIVRSPVWNADITVNQYSADKISLDISAPRGGVLIIRNGEFPIAKGKSIEVHLNGKSQLLHITDTQLKIEISSGFKGRCELG